jgi:hypothetical protein
MQNIAFKRKIHEVEIKYHSTAQTEIPKFTVRQRKLLRFQAVLWIKVASKDTFQVT